MSITLESDSVRYRSNPSISAFVIEQPTIESRKLFALVSIMVGAEHFCDFFSM